MNEMNRLIIIGNGFDLAHGLPTSYKDFIQYLIGKILEDTLDNGGFEAKGILSAEWKGGNRQPGDRHVLQIIENIKTDGGALKDLLDDRQYIRVPNSAMNFGNGNPFDFKINNFFVKSLLGQSCERWVDIEESYYNELLKLVKDSQVDAKIEDLNRGFQFLIEKLEEYLSREIENPTVIEDILELCARSSFPWGADLIEPIESISDIKKIVFLNFNYTSTLSEYISRLKYKEKNISFELIQIHGKVGSPENPIIFGFGDEMDDNYKVLEKANDNRLLDYIKSFGYFKTNNYKRLERLVESKPFQVFVMGHSCGLSDRIMLNMIFEHQNCETIRVFYHRKGEGVDDYKALTQNISRHFNDKKLMRKRIVPKVGSTEMPQLGD